MKKLLLTILLTLISTSAMAEMTAIDNNDTYTLYADKASISRKGNIARMWEMRDFKSTQNNGEGAYLSSTVYQEYDCANKMINMLALTNYSENMRKGIVVETYKIDKYWDYIAPGTMHESSWKTACGKK